MHSALTIKLRTGDPAPGFTLPDAPKAVLGGSLIGSGGGIQPRSTMLCITDPLSTPEGSS
jgi:hypothetical protein